MFYNERVEVSIEKAIQRFEIGAVILTALGKFIFYDILHLQLVYILIMFCFWVVYAVWRLKRNPTSMKEWGFRTDNFLSVFKMVLPFGLVCISSCFIVGYFLETIHLNWHIIPIIFLYPIFGTLQQFLLMSLVAGNLQKLNVRNLFIILITAFLFAFLHYPEWWLILGTFILASFYSYVYLREKNLYILGIFHGIIGAIFYYTIVSKDPFVEVFGRYL